MQSCGFQADARVGRVQESVWAKPEPKEPGWDSFPTGCFKRSAPRGGPGEVATPDGLRLPQSSGRAHDLRSCSSNGRPYHEECLREGTGLSRICFGPDASTGALKGTYFPLVGSSSYPSKPDGMTLEEEKAPGCFSVLLLDSSSSRTLQMLTDDHLLFQHPDAPAVLSTGSGRHWPHGRGNWVLKLFACSDVVMMHHEHRCQASSSMNARP